MSILIIKFEMPAFGSFGKIAHSVNSMGKAAILEK